jgi:hypothetical protein
MPPFDRSPQPYVRACGLMYLAIIALGLFGEVVVRGGLASATAAALAANETLWRTGIVTDLLMHVLDVPLIVLFYLLLRPVDAALALLSTVFNIVQTAVLALNKLSLVVPLLVATRSSLPAPVADEVARLGVTVHAYGFAIGLVFFGMTCLVRGHLLRRSRLLPQAIGVLLMVAGACYLLNSAALLLAPALARLLFPWVMLPVLVAELALAAWLLVKGIDLAQWQRLQDR